MAGKKTETTETTPAAEAAPAVLTIQERITAMMAHLLALCTSFLGPLVIYVARKNRSEFIAYHALQSVFFQLAVLVVLLVCGLLSAAWVGFQGLFPLVFIGNVIYVVSTGLKALDGDSDEYIILGQLARRALEQ